MFYVSLYKGREKGYGEWDYYSFSSLDNAREFAIKAYLAGRTEGLSLYITRAFHSNAVLFGKSIKGVPIGKSKSNMYGGVVRYRGSFYWVLNDKDGMKYKLNMDGTLDKGAKRLL